MIHREENTIKAINKLKDCFPYAAGMLAYVVIERQLKEYILKHRNGKLAAREVTLTNHKKVKFEDYASKSDEEFINKVLTKMTLANTEKVLGIDPSNGAANDRNDMMHSNLYIVGERMLSEEERHRKNIEHFEKAKSHLIRTFKDFSDIPLDEKEGKLVFST